MVKESKVDLEFILKQALDATTDCFGLINQDDTVVYCNSTFASVFGLCKEDIIGSKNADLLRLAWTSKRGIRIECDDFDQWYQDLEVLQETKLLNQFETDLTDGRWFKITRMKLDSGYTIFSGVDITVLKETQKYLEKANQRIETIANTDLLTGMQNRRAFKQLAKQAIKQCKKNQQSLALLILEVANFKDINDNYGYESADNVLYEFAARCSKELRPGDSFCRIRGARFTILLPMTSISTACKISEKIRSSIAADGFYVEKQGCYLDVSISIGLSYLTESDQLIEDLLSRAEMTLYASKKNEVK